MSARFKHSDNPSEARPGRRRGLMHVDRLGKKLGGGALIAMTALLLAGASYLDQRCNGIWEHRDRAWRAVHAPGNTGKIEPLEYLNQEDGFGCFKRRCLFAVVRREELAETDLSGVYLENVQLPGAILRGAKLRRADLSHADLSGADLTGADLKDAKLVDANLIGAKLPKANLVGAYLIGTNLSASDLSGADLTEANLGKANLTDAKLDLANLNGADLAAATGLSHEYLASACGDERTLLPPSLIVHPCH